jgi:hypothetical protein
MMSSIIEENTDLSPQAFILTSKTLEKFGDVRLRAPSAYEQAYQILNKAQIDLFFPYLTRTARQFVAFEFERLSYLFFPPRLAAMTLLFKALGPSEFGARYVSAISRMSKIFADKAKNWALDPADVENAFSRYLSAAIRILGKPTSEFGQEDSGKITNILKSVTKVDFGFTALVLVFEESIVPERWIVQETFSMTSKALDEYHAAVSALFTNKKAQAPIAGSLEIEGDVDQALESFSKALQSLFPKQA